MKITTSSEYSLLALLYIGRYQDIKLIKVEEISQKYKIPKKYLELLMNGLKQNGYIIAKRGPSGGYRLAKPANEISLNEIIKFKDVIKTNNNKDKNFWDNKPIEDEKKLINFFKDINDYINEKLNKTKLSDLI